MYIINNKELNNKNNIIKEEIVLNIIRKYFREKPIIKQFYSEGSYVAKLEFKRYNRVIKINTSKHEWKISKEIYIYELLKKNKLFAPKIYYTNLEDNPKYYIMEYLGDNLIDLYNIKTTTINKLYKEMGKYFAKIHSIRFEKQGRLYLDKIYEESLDKSYKIEFNLFLNKLEKLKIFNKKEIEKCKSLFYNFHNSNESVLCHTDFGPWQVIINNKKISGIIDWEWSISSYSVADFARTQNLISIFGGRYDLFKEGYEKIKKLPKNYDTIKIPYQISHLLNILYHYKKSNNENNFNKCKEYFNKLIN
jgi:fructosamine-3-kinase